MIEGSQIRLKISAIPWVAVAVFSLFANLLILTGPLYMLQVYDRVLSAYSLETLVALSLIAGFLFALMAVLDWSRGRLLARVGSYLGQTLRARCIGFDLRRKAEGQREAALAHAALRSLERVFASPGLLAVFDLPWTPIFFGAIFLLHPALALLAFVGGMIVLMLGLAAQKIGAEPAGDSAGDQADVFAENARFLVAQRMIKAASVWGAATAFKPENSEKSDLKAALTTAARSLRMALQSAVLGLGAFLVVKDSLGAGAMIAASILTGRALAPLEQVAAHWPILQDGRRAWFGLRETFSPELVEIAHMPHDISAALKVTDLALTSGRGGAVVLRGVSFALGAGQILGVIGPSGAGKSILVEGLMGVRPRVAGDIRCGEMSIDQRTAQNALFFGYLPQLPCLFPGTIAENIARLQAEFEMEDVIVAARKAGVHEEILTFQGGYGRRVGDGGANLSFGQTQRICLARAHYGDPAILILDEPGAGQDGAGNAAVQSALQIQAREGRCAIICSNRPSQIAGCSHLLVLDRGRQVAFGPREEVLQSATLAGAMGGRGQAA